MMKIPAWFQAIFLMLSLVLITPESIAGIPTFQESNALYPPPFSIGLNYGCDIAIDNDVLVVSSDADNPNQRVFVYRRAGSSWEFETTLDPPDTPDSLHLDYGRSVAVHNDTIVVGTIVVASVGGESVESAVVVYRRTDKSWEFEALLSNIHPDKTSYGTTVAIDNEVITAGLSGGKEDFGGPVKVFRFVEDEWIEEASISKLVGRAVERNVDLVGDLLVIGQPEDIKGSSSNFGKVFIYRHRDGAWLLETQIDPPFEDEFDVDFGRRIATDGTRVFVYWLGSIHVYARSGEAWKLEDTLTSQGGPTGATLDAHNGIVLAGSSGDDLLFENAGTVQVFARIENTWQEVARLEESNPAEGDRFGSAVSLSQHGAAIAADHDDSSGLDAGAAFVFDTFGDCNGNGAADIIDISTEISSDADGDGIPDDCACAANLDASGDVGFADLLIALDAWGMTGVPADLDGGGVGFSDLLMLLDAWGPCSD